MPPQRLWPSTTICRTFRPCTANSSAAEVEWQAWSGSQGGTRLATLRTVKISPGAALKIVSGAARESQQAMTMTSGACPCSASRR